MYGILGLAGNQLSMNRSELNLRRCGKNNNKKWIDGKRLK